MSKRNRGSFRDMNIVEKTAVVVGIGLLIFFVAAFVFGIYFFGLAGIFELLGVQYKSVWSLLVFVVCFIFLGIIVELFSKAIYKLSVRNMTGKVNVIIVRFIIEGTSNLLVLYTVDEFLNGMILSMKTEIIVAFLIAVLEIVFDDKK
ncbi:hypothetical protein GCM10009001_06200 [Virgibacillus siamensis]|uniref:Regulatory protein YrvL n=1 Tax=Virgibacillus siamensis TaxID=480071 RepID=A0ABP3QL23_9BACI